MWRVFSRNIFLGRPKEAELTPLLTMLEPQDAAAPRSKPSAGIEPDACQHLAHMGRREASAESTERDQLKNVRDAEGLVVATDHS